MTAPRIPLTVLFGDPDRSSPSLSPDANHIAYLAPGEGVSNIWVQPTAAGQARPVTRETERPVVTYSWAAGGRHILYPQHDGDENTHLRAVDVMTGEDRDLTPFDDVQARLIKTELRSPTAALIGLNLRDRRLHDAYLADLVTGELIRVADNPGFARWIPDAHLRPRGAVRIDEAGGSAVLVHDGDGGAGARFTAGPWRRPRVTSRSGSPPTEPACTCCPPRARTRRDCSGSTCGPAYGRLCTLTRSTTWSASAPIR
jgi:dipeptidyl aminopeptidase/acylaminoacyl peptidase